MKSWCCLTERDLQLPCTRMEAHDSLRKESGSFLDLLGWREGGRAQLAPESKALPCQISHFLALFPYKV